MVKVATSWRKLPYRQVDRRHRLHRRHSFHAAHIRQAMLIIIPPAICQVNATHKRHRLVNNDKLFVVGPEVHRGGHMVWVSHHLRGEREPKISLITQFTPPESRSAFFGCSERQGNTGVFKRCIHTDCWDYWSYMAPPELGVFPKRQWLLMLG